MLLAGLGVLAAVAVAVQLTPTAAQVATAAWVAVAVAVAMACSEWPAWAAQAAWPEVVAVPRVRLELTALRVRLVAILAAPELVGQASIRGAQSPVAAPMAALAAPTRANPTGTEEAVAGLALLPVPRAEKAAMAPPVAASAAGGGRRRCRPGIAGRQRAYVGCLRQRWPGWDWGKQCWRRRRRGRGSAAA